MLFPVTPVLVTGLLVETPINHMGNNVEVTDGSQLISDGSSILSSEGYGSGFWDVEQYIDTEVYVTIKDTVGAFNLYWRINNPGTGWSGHYLRASYNSDYIAYHTESEYWGYKYISRPLEVDDQLGIRMLAGDIFELYLNGVLEDTQEKASNALGYIGLEVDSWEGIGFTNFGGGSPSSLDDCLPDADVITTGWTTAPLFSKINDESDATVIQATAV